jgi:adenosine deaminase
MKKIFLYCFLLFSISVSGQSVENYFEHIRNNDAELVAFFSQMPKGGDLHNHYSGSVYAETYIGYVVRKDYVINKSTLEVIASMPNHATTDWVHFSDLAKNKTLDAYKQKLMQKWSAKDYNGVSYPSDKQFFEAFAAFGIANENQSRIDTGILELKNRAIKEHVSYIELMLSSIKCTIADAPGMNYGQQLELAQSEHDEKATSIILGKMYLYLIENKISDCAVSFNDGINKMHKRLAIDDELFTMRYMNYVSRASDPVSLFKSLVAAFESAERSNLVVGVNIVAPEDGEVSMHDYWLHMQMFKFCHDKYPLVKYSMHAGELTLGIVKPEELTWHINEAVRIAGADRIGHGVDMAYEKNPYELLKYMANKKIAIEINLYSNEFILKVKGEDHPFKLYKDFNVPIVISTDDAGILRSNLIHQYELLAKRYKYVSYSDIKRYVYNSIDYSFIKEDWLKRKLRSKLDADFRQFEKEVLSIARNE